MRKIIVCQDLLISFHAELSHKKGSSRFFRKPPQKIHCLMCYLTATPEKSFTVWLRVNTLPEDSMPLLEVSVSENAPTYLMDITTFPSASETTVVPVLVVV